MREVSYGQDPSCSQLTLTNISPSGQQSSDYEIGFADASPGTTFAQYVTRPSARL